MKENCLQTIMAPKSVAIVGASNNPMKMGTLQCLNLMTSDYPGKIFPVHPVEKKVFGLTAYPSIADLPQAPDLALLVVPTRLVVDMMDEFGKIGTRSAIIITAGFAETGADGKELQKKLLEVCSRHNIRFLGPNCMGVMNTALPFNVTVTPFQDKPGGLSLASQSGTYLAQTLSYLKQRGVRLQKAMSVGNEANIDLVDCLEYLGADKETRAIGMYIETLRRADKFLEVARKITREKPIIAQYVGGTKAGARSGASHTGALAGPDFIYDGLFAQAGIIRVSSIEEVYRIGHTLAASPPLNGKRMAILTHSGGPGTAMSDICDRNDLLVSDLPGPVKEKIRAVIPPHASANNPVDLTFIMESELMNQVIPKILLESDAVDGLLIHGFMDTGWAKQVYPSISKVMDIKYEQLEKLFSMDLGPFLALREKHQKPIVCSSFLGTEDHAVSTLLENSVPLFDSPEKAAFAMSCLYRHYQIRNRQIDAPVASGIPAEVVEQLQSSAPGSLDEHEAKQILAKCGIPVCREKLAQSAEQTLDAAREIGFPVAVKACSAQIAHKTEKGLVHLNIVDENGVLKAWEAIQKNVPQSQVLVCEMLGADREFMAGVTRFPGFGPLVLFGLGGIQAEALGDRAIRMAPFGQAEALRLANSIKANKLLGSFRNLPAVDERALADILIALGNLALACPRIKELDINPILIVKGRPVVVDALMVLE
ncbi:MAG: acetate--CoA ligase family protein [Desulfatibacillaceae bacterium]|nr:acetate--CoA ligase family protein [Desulfatibacillaceae bacterium]